MGATREHAAEDEPTQEIILVHGTILLPRLMRGPGWTRTEHRFVEAVRQKVPDARVSEFRWRGGNLHADRLRAANELVDRLLESGAARVLIVAHSHGGNVARIALGMLGTVERDRVTLISLATPFLNVRTFNLLDNDLDDVRQAASHYEERQHAAAQGQSTEGDTEDMEFDLTPPDIPVLHWRNWLGMLYTMGVGAILVLSILVVAGVYPGPPARESARYSALVGMDLEIVYAGIGISILSLGFALVVAALFVLAWGLGRIRLGWTCGFGLRPSAIVERLDTSTVGDVAHDVIAVENDEAGWALSVGQIAGSIGATLGGNAYGRSRFGRARNYLAVPGVFALLFGVGFTFDELNDGQQVADAASTGFGHVFAFGYMFPFGGAVDEAALVYGLVLVGMSTLGLFGMLIHMLEYLATGWDALALASVARISVSPMAPGLHPTRLVNLEWVRADSIRHSAVYESPSAIRAVLEHVDRWNHATQ